MTTHFNHGKDLYQQSGVHIDKADNLVQWLQDSSRTDSKIGGFSALFKPDFSTFKTPLLVSSTDGVGTKLLLALEEQSLNGLGLDLVAMCVNDLYTCGAKPLFFLDYYAPGKLQSEHFKLVLSSMKKGLELCQCSLIGGETAELPGIYQQDHFDLAGFVVGVVDESKVLGPKKVTAGDQLYALPSSGFHSNGFSLLRKFLADKPELRTALLVKHLLQPTTIYYQLPRLLETLSSPAIHAMSHITGGGLSGNIARMIPEGLAAFIEVKQISTPTWMKELLGSFDEHIMNFESVFNLGIGMVLSVEKNSTKEFETMCQEQGLNPSWLGEVRQEKSGEETVKFCA
jgi:phosphoribosylformylglycinamidine cyclo-ligase